MYRLKQLRISGVIGLLVVALLVLDLVLLPRLARADYVVMDKQIDNYHVTVWARPNPIAEGKVHLLLRVGRQLNVGQEYPVQGATVTVRFEELPEDGVLSFTPKNYYRDLAAGEADPGTYEWDDSLFSSGHYRAVIKLSSNLGKSETSFEFKALPAPDDRLFSIALLALFPLSLMTLVFMYMRRPKDEAKTDKEPAAPQEVSPH